MSNKLWAFLKDAHLLNTLGYSILGYMKPTSCSEVASLKYGCGEYLHTSPWVLQVLHNRYRLSRLPGIAYPFKLLKEGIS